MTDLTRQNNTPAEIEKISQQIPIQRLARPQEIADVVAFLCSEQNTYLVGQTIIVDGGYSCL
jgi:3-oxoacyl-[acyl-carrier protein] reductase